MVHGVVSKFPGLVSHMVIATKTDDSKFIDDLYFVGNLELVAAARLYR
jgi:hypothetical protein